jgi:hypothetical protein
LRGCKGLRTGDRNAQHQQSLGREPHGRITKRYFAWVKGVELSGCVRGRLLSFDGLLLHVYSRSVVCFVLLILVRRVEGVGAELTSLSAISRHKYKRPRNSIP